MVRLKPFDPSGLFRPSSEVRRLAVRGAGAMWLSSSLGLAMHIVSTVVLARLLTPEDFGLVTMVLTWSFLLANWGFNGFTEAIIKRDDLSHALASNVFWINFGISLVLTGVFASAGSLLAWFFGDPRIPYVAASLSLVILLNGTWVVHVALLTRAMRFGAVSANDRIAHAAYVGVAILFSWAGWGYWALVAASIAMAAATSAGAWILCAWVPSRPRRVLGTGSLVRFAVNVYAHFTFNYCARNLDNFLVGWRFGAQSLGFYKKAYDLFAMTADQIVSPLTHVAVSALSRVSKNASEYRHYFLRVLGVVAFIAMGIGGDLALVGKDVIFFLLGPAWVASARIFTFFGLGIGMMMLYSTHGWIHLSIGRPERWVRWGLVEFAVTGALFVVALPWGPVGIAMAWTVSFWILTIPALWYAGKPNDFPIRSVIGVLLKYLAASLFAGSASVIILRGSYFVVSQTASEAVIRIVLVSTIFAVLYLAAVTFLHGGFAPYRQFWRLFQEILPWSRSTKPATPSPRLVEPVGPRPEEELG